MLIFKGHSAPVVKLTFENGLVFTGGADHVIHAWNLVVCVTRTRSTLATSLTPSLSNPNPTRSIADLSSECAGNPYQKTGDLVDTYLGHSGWIVGLAAESTVMISTSRDETIRIWAVRRNVNDRRVRARTVQAMLAAAADCCRHQDNKCLAVIPCPNDYWAHMVRCYNGTLYAAIKGLVVAWKLTNPRRVTTVCRYQPHQASFTHSLTHSQLILPCATAIRRP